MTRVAAIAATIVALLAGAATALADPPAGHNPQGDKLGVITPKGKGHGGGGSTSLVDHGGAVMTTNTTYAIFWGPSDSWPTGYIAAIDKYFTDVAADSGLLTNVYSVATQYSSIEYQSTFGGGTDDTATYPTSGCRDRGLPICLSDSQLTGEIQRLITDHTLPAASGTNAYFIFTPPNVGSCAGGIGCAFKNFCAYHGWFPATSPTTIYANMPFADQSAGCADAAAGQPAESPAGGSADATLDGASHEHNEMITDPFGTGWFTNGGFEIGDLCNFIYGSPVSGSPDLSTGSAYNQVINSDHYFIQEEWSNSSSACLQHL